MRSKWVIGALLLFTVGLISGCSGAGGGTPNASTAFGVPSPEMKCNGVACIN